MYCSRLEDRKYLASYKNFHEKESRASSSSASSPSSDSPAICNRCHNSVSSIHIGPGCIDSEPPGLSLDLYPSCMCLSIPSIYFSRFGDSAIRCTFGAAESATSSRGAKIDTLIFNGYASSALFYRLHPSNSQAQGAGDLSYEIPSHSFPPYSSQPSQNLSHDSNPHPAARLQAHHPSSTHSVSASSPLSSAASAHSFQDCYPPVGISPRVHNILRASLVLDSY